MFAEWVAEAIERMGVSNAELGRRLTDRLGRGIDRAAVQKMTQGKRGVSADEALAIAEMSGLALPGYEAARVPVISWVSAGRMGDSNSQDDVDSWLHVAGLGRGDYFATVVRGNSMDRLSPEDSIIIVDRSLTGLQNNKPYLFALRGEATYKLWNERLQALMPFSTTPHDPIPVDHEWGSWSVIGRVRRTMMDL